MSKLLLERYVELLLEKRRERFVEISSGESVAWGSEAHLADLDERILYMSRWRNKHPKGSAARENYSRIVQRLKGEARSARNQNVKQLQEKQTSVNEEILRQYVRSLVLEDTAGDAVIPVSSGVSYATGDARSELARMTGLSSIADVFGVGAAEAEKLAKTAVMGAKIGKEILKSIVTSQSPNYTRIFDDHKAEILKTNEKYKAFYDSVNSIYEKNADVRFFSIMAAPQVYLASRLAMKTPAVTKALLSIITAGASDEILAKAKNKIEDETRKYFGEKEVTTQQRRQEILKREKESKKKVLERVKDQVLEKGNFGDTEKFKSSFVDMHNDLLSKTEKLLSKDIGLEELMQIYYPKGAPEGISKKAKEIKEIKDEKQRNDAEKAFVVELQKIIKNVYLNGGDSDASGKKIQGINELLTKAREFGEENPYYQDLLRVKTKIESL